MLVGSCQKLQNHDLNITVDSWPISRISSFKYLGLYIDENLTWQDHTMSVLQKVLSRIHCLYRLNPVPDNLLDKLYCVFVLPIIDYCDVVWMPSFTLLFKRLERLHSKFSHSKSPTSRSSMAITLAEQRRYQTATQGYRSLHKISPSYLHNTFHYAVEITSHGDRNEHASPLCTKSQDIIGKE